MFFVQKITRILILVEINSIGSLNTHAYNLMISTSNTYWKSEGLSTYYLLHIDNVGGKERQESLIKSKREVIFKVINCIC